MSLFVLVASIFFCMQGLNPAAEATFRTRVSRSTAEIRRKDGRYNLTDISRTMLNYTIPKETPPAENILFKDSFWTYQSSGELTNAGGYASSALAEIFRTKASVYPQEVMFELLKTTLHYANYPASIIVLRIIQRVYPDFFARLGTIVDASGNTILHALTSAHPTFGYYQRSRFEPIKAAVQTLVRILVTQCSADVNKKNTVGKTALELGFSNELFARTLMEHGAVINWHSSGGHPLYIYLETHPGVGLTDDDIHPAMLEDARVINTERDNFIIAAIKASGETLTQIISAPCYGEPIKIRRDGRAVHSTKHENKALSAGQAIKEFLCNDLVTKLSETHVTALVQNAMYDGVKKAIIAGNHALINLLRHEAWSTQLLDDAVYELFCTAISSKDLPLLKILLGSPLLHPSLTRTIGSIESRDSLLIRIASWCDEPCFIIADNFLATLTPDDRTRLGALAERSPEVYARCIALSGVYKDLMRAYLGPKAGELMQLDVQKPKSRVTDDVLLRIITSCNITRCTVTTEAGNTLAHFCAEKGYKKSLRELAKTHPEVLYQENTAHQTPLAIIISRRDQDTITHCMDMIASALDSNPAEARRHLPSTAAAGVAAGVEAVTDMLIRGLDLFSGDASKARQLNYFWEHKNNSSLCSLLDDTAETQAAFDSMTQPDTAAPILVQCAAWGTPDLVSRVIKLLEHSTKTDALYEHDEKIYARAIKAALKKRNTTTADVLLCTPAEKMHDRAALTLCLMLRKHTKKPSREVVRFLCEHEPTLSMTNEDGIPLARLLEARDLQAGP